MQDFEGLSVLAIAKAAILRPWFWCFLALLAEDVVVGTGTVRKTITISKGAEKTFAPQLELAEVVRLFNKFLLVFSQRKKESNSIM